MCGSTHDILADVSDGLQRGLLHHVGAGGVRQVGRELLDEIRPQPIGQLSAREVRHALRRRAWPRDLSAQRLQYLQEVRQEVRQEAFL